jgi:hypothetical protein
MCACDRGRLCPRCAEQERDSDETEQREREDDARDAARGEVSDGA